MLVAADSELDYQQIASTLAESPERFVISWAPTYSSAIEHVSGTAHDVVLLSNGLSAKTSVEFIDDTNRFLECPPIIVIFEQLDRASETAAMRAGASDCVALNDVSCTSLERTIRFSIERCRTAKSLRVSEDRYRTFVENSTEGIWRFELELPMPISLSERDQLIHLARHAFLAECNEAMAHIYGFVHPSSLVGMRFGEFFDVDDTAEHNYMRLLVRNQYRLVNTESFEVDRLGRPKYILHNLIGVVEDEMLSRIWGSQNDITARKQFEDDQAQLAAIVLYSDNSIFSLDVDGLLVSWNKAAEHLYGYGALEVIGRTVFFLGDDVWKAELNRIQERILIGERMPQFQTTHVTSFGNLVDVSVATSPIFSATNVVSGYSFIVRDIGEQKAAVSRLAQSEANMARAQHVAHIGSWELDLGNREQINANPLRWSDETFRIFGLEPGAVNVSNDLFLESVHPDDRDAVQSQLAQSVATNVHYSFIHRIIRPNGDVRLVHEMAQYFERESPHSLPKLIGTIHDITERSAADERIRFSSLLLAQVQNAIIATDLNGCVTYWNNFAETLYQWSADEALGKNIIELTVVPHEMQNVINMVANMAETGCQSGEALVHRKDGSTFPAHIVNTYFNDASGKVAGIVGVSIDITATKNTERLLTNAELEQRQLAEHLQLQRTSLAEAQSIAKVGSWQIESLWGTLTWSDETHNIYGISPSEFDHTYEGALAFVHPDDRAMVHAAFASSIENHTRCVIDHRIQLDDSTIKYVHQRCETHYDDNGVPIQTIGTVQDVTFTRLMMSSLAESEHKFRRIVETTHEGVTQVDERGTITYVNQRFCDMLGYSQDELMGRSAFDFVATANSVAARQMFLRRAIAGPEQFDREFIHKTGAPVWAIVSVSPLYDDDGAVIGSFSMTTDITDRKKADDELIRSKSDLLVAHANLEKRVADRTIQLQHATDEAERANAAKSVFLSRMSHELRTPMNSILGFAQLMEMDSPDEKQAVRLGHIIKSGQHLLELINEVLDLARIESGRLRVSSDTVSVEQCIQGAVDIIRPLCEKRGQHLIFDPELATNSYIHGDPQRLLQILLNLLSNASKFTNDHGIVMIGCEDVDEAQISIYVSDSGRGICDDNVHRLYQPFDRLDAAPTAIEGTGLGLALSRNFVELMGGSIHMQSVVDVGTSFHVALKRAPSELPLEVAIPSFDKEDGPKLEHVVLYIDDNLANLKLMEHVLTTQKQFNLVTATAGHRGVALASEMPIAVILLDLQLPDGSGEDVLAELKAKSATKEIPVIIVSADATPGQIKRLIDAGAYDYITKPFDLILLMKVLHECVGARPTGVHFT